MERLNSRVESIPVGIRSKRKPQPVYRFASRSSVRAHCYPRRRGVYRRFAYLFAEEACAVNHPFPVYGLEFTFLIRGLESCQNIFDFLNKPQRRCDPLDQGAHVPGSCQNHRQLIIGSAPLRASPSIESASILGCRTCAGLKRSLLVYICLGVKQIATAAGIAQTSNRRMV